MDCAGVQELLPAYVDGELSPSERRRIEEHVLGCWDCWTLLRRLRWIQANVATWPEVPSEMQPWLATIDLTLRHRLRRERRRRPTVIAVGERLGLAVSAAILLLLALGFALVQTGQPGATISRALASASARATEPLLSRLSDLGWPPAPADQIAIQRGQLALVQAITILDYRQASARTVDSREALQPALEALARARFVRKDPPLAARIAPQTYLMRIHRRDGSVVSLVYWPNPAGPNLADPSTGDWWMAPGLDAALQALLPSPVVAVASASSSDQDRAPIPTTRAGSATAGVTISSRLTPLAAPRPVLQLPAPAVSLAADPAQPSRIYALLATNALYRSDDGGQSWRKLAFPAAEDAELASADRSTAVYLLPQRDVQVAARRTERVYVVAGQVLYGSDDAGASWRPLDNAIYAWTVADPAGEVLYVWHVATSTGASGLYRSDDAGATWQQVYAGPFPPSLATQRCPCSHEGISALVADPRDPNTLYAGTDYGVFRSTDGGKSWSALVAGLPPTTSPFRWTPILAAAPDGTVYALSEVWSDPTSGYAALLRLRPGETSWTRVGDAALARWQRSDAPLFGLGALVADPRTPGRLYLGTARGLLISDDGGDRWSASSATTGAVYRVAVASPGSATHLSLWTDDGFVEIQLPARDGKEVGN